MVDYQVYFLGLPRSQGDWNLQLNVGNCCFSDHPTMRSHRRRRRRPRLRAAVAPPPSRRSRSCRTTKQCSSVPVPSPPRSPAQCLETASQLRNPPRLWCPRRNPRRSPKWRQLSQGNDQPVTEVQLHSSIQCFSHSLMGLGLGLRTTTGLRLGLGLLGAI